MFRSIIKQIPKKLSSENTLKNSMASMQLFKPADKKCYYNSYSNQSLAKSWGQTAPTNPYCTNYSMGSDSNESECFTEALVRPHGAGYHGSNSSVTQSSLIHGKPAANHFYSSGFPVKPMGSHSAHGYSQQATYGGAEGSYGAASHGSYGAASQGSYGAASHGSYGAASHGSYGAASHGSYGAAPHGSYGAAAHGSYGFGQHESLGSGHGSFAMPQHKILSSQQHGSYSPGHQESYAMEKKESFGSTGQPFTGGWIKRKKKSYRRTYSGCRSVDEHGDSGSDSEEESEDETEDK